MFCLLEVEEKIKETIFSTIIWNNWGLIFI